MTDRSTSRLHQPCAVLLATLLLAACAVDTPDDDGSRSASSAQTGETAAPDADYDEGFDLDPGGAPLSGANPNLTSARNDDDPQRPPNMPKNWLYVRNTCGPTACSSMYDLYAQPSALSPRYAFHNGCIADADDFQGGTNYSDIKSFLSSELPGTTWIGEGTPVSSAPTIDDGWATLTSLIDARKPFVAGVSWDDPPETDSVGHVMTVVDYAVRAGGTKYVLIMNFGHYKWYPWLDKGTGAAKKYGFHSRWHVTSSGNVYYRIYGATPIAQSVWTAWHSQP